MSVKSEVWKHLRLLCVSSGYVLCQSVMSTDEHMRWWGTEGTRGAGWGGQSFLLTVYLPVSSSDFGHQQGKQPMSPLHLHGRSPTQKPRTQSLFSPFDCGSEVPFLTLGPFPSSR